MPPIAGGTQFAFRRRERRNSDREFLSGRCVFNLALLLFCGDLPRNDLLKPVHVYPVPLRGFDKSVAPGCGSLIGRIEQTDFEQYPAQFGFIVVSYLLRQ